MLPSEVSAQSSHAHFKTPRRGIGDAGDGNEASVALGNPVDKRSASSRRRLVDQLHAGNGRKEDLISNNRQLSASGEPSGA